MQKYFKVDEKMGTFFLVNDCIFFQERTFFQFFCGRKQVGIKIFNQQKEMLNIYHTPTVLG